MTITLSLFAALALAHGGDDHGVPVAASVSDGGGDRTAEATSDTFELVLRWAPGHRPETDLDLFLADATTNRPIADARITLRLTAGALTASEDARAGTRPGTYHAHLPAPPEGAAWSAIATIDAAGRGDLLTVERLALDPPEPRPAAIAPHDDEHGVGFFVVIGLALVGATALAFVAGRATARRAAVAMLAAGLASAAPERAVAHGGDEHDPPVPASAGGDVGLAKDIQFLLGLETARAERRVMVPRLRVTGEVVAPPDALAILRAPRAGRLEATGDRLVSIGHAVARGDVIAWVVDVPTGAERATLTAERARAQATGEGAAARLVALRKELARKEALAGEVAAQELDALRATIRETEATARAARDSVKVLDLRGDVLRVPLVAPFDGLVVTWSAGLAIGASVAPDVDLVTLVAPERLEVAALLFEDDAPRVAREARAIGVTSDGRTLGLEPAGSSPRVDPQTRTIELRYRPGGSAAPLVLGAFVAVDVPVGVSASHVAVPASAIVERDGVATVYVKEGAERFRPTPVVVRVREGDLVAIEGDVRAGERVVVRGASLLRHAAQVAPGGAPIGSQGAR